MSQLGNNIKLWHLVIKFSVRFQAVFFIGFFLSCGLSAYSMNNKLEIGIPPFYLTLFFLVISVFIGVIIPYWNKKGEFIFRNKFVGPFLKENFSELEYHPQSHITESDFKLSNLFENRHDSYVGSDLIKYELTDSLSAEFSQVRTFVSRREEERATYDDPNVLTLSVAIFEGVIYKIAHKMNVADAIVVQTPMESKKSFLVNSILKKEPEEVNFEHYKEGLGL